jgi:2-aminobenzoate-CoA ligase
MKDSYPRLDTLPHEWLTAPEDQPDYLELPGVVLDCGVDLGSAMCDAQVRAGRGEAVAIIHHESGRALTFAELAAASDRAAAAFSGLGIRPGDRIALRGANCPEMIIAAIAAWKIGAVVALIPALARVAEVEFFLADTQPRLLVLAQPEATEVLAAFGRVAGLTVVSVDGATPGALAWDELPAAGPHPAVPADLDRVAIVWHTGGTTGRPKGCYHTQRRFLLGGLSLGQAAGAAPGQRWAAAAPIGHALGFIHSTNFTLLNGVTLVLVSDFTRPAAVLEALAEREVTQFTAIAATWGRLLELLEGGAAPEPTALTRGFAMWQSSSAAEVADGWRRRGIELLNNFGSTAFATWVLVPPRDRTLPQATLGRPAPGYEVRALEPEPDGEVRAVRRMVPAGEPGQMAVRGPTGLTYWRLPGKQRVDVRSGYSLQDDLIRFDDGGLAEYLGRTDFMISTAGNKVAPAEVETVLGRHPAVREAVVFGLPDATRQETVAAFVVVHPGVEPSAGLRRELQDFVKARLAPYKYPRRLDFIDAVPRDNVGKVQPRVLRERVMTEIQVPAQLRHTSRRGLRYGRDGDGPVVVLVHGWCLSRQVWMYLEQALVASGHTVITPDLAGYGESAGLRPRESLAGHAGDLTDLLDELDVDRVVLAGFAFGAGVIFSAADYRRVRALVSIAMPSAATAPYDRMQRAILRDWPQFAARSAGAIVPEQASTQTRDWLARMYGATSLGAALAGLAILRSFEPAGLEKRWDVPAYFVHGSADPIVPATVSQDCAKRFGAEYLEVESAAHLVVIDQKEAVHQIMEEVLAAGA